MATENKFPPDVPKDWDEAEDQAENVAGKIRSKASDLADRATETVKDGYYRARDAFEDDPIEAVREGGEALIDTIKRNPLATFGLGALSVGLVAWASLRGATEQSSWRRYEPDYGYWRKLIGDYSNDAESAAKSGDKWLRSHADQARDYADYGGRYLARRAEKEPIAALLGVGIAVYFIGSLLTSAVTSNEPERPAPRRRSGRR